MALSERQKTPSQHYTFFNQNFYWNPINNYRYNQTCYGVGCHKVSVLVMVNYVLLQLIAKMRRTHILIEQRNGYWRSTERAVCAREKHVTTNPGLPGSTLFLQFLVKYSTVQKPWPTPHFFILCLENVCFHALPHITLCHWFSVQVLHNLTSLSIFSPFPFLNDFLMTPFH